MNSSTHRSIPRRARWIAVICFALIIVTAVLLLSRPDSSSSGQNPYTQIIGPNGQRIFADPNRALAQAKKDYKEGFAAIRREFKLWPVNRWNYMAYKNLGWQLTTGSDEAKRQGVEISKFFDIYENNFK